MRTYSRLALTGSFSIVLLVLTTTTWAQGIRFEYQLSVDSVRVEGLQHIADDLMLRLAENGHLINIESSDSELLMAEPTDSATLLVLEQALGSETFSMLEITREDQTIRARFREEHLTELHTQALGSVLAIIEERLEILAPEQRVGASVYQSGDEGIIIELPGANFDDLEVASRIFHRRGWLELHLVSSENATFWQSYGSLVTTDNPCSPEYAWVTCPTLEDLRVLAEQVEQTRASLGRLADVIVRGSEERYAVAADWSPVMRYRPILLSDDVVITNSAIADATAQTDEYGNPYVSLNLNEAARIHFCTVTTEHVGETLAIVLDDVVVSAPEINEAICGGRIRITVGGSSETRYQDANDIVTALRGGLFSPLLELVEVTQLVRRIDPLVGIDVDSTDFAEQLNTFFVEGDFTPLGRPSDNPGGYRLSEEQELGIDARLSSAENGLLQTLRFDIVLNDPSADALSEMEQQLQQLCDEYEVLLGPSLRAGTGPIFGCYWTDAADEITSRIEYFPPNEGGPAIRAEINYR